MSFSTGGPKIFCAFDRISSSFLYSHSEPPDGVAAVCYMVTANGVDSYPITDASMVFSLDPKNLGVGGPYTGTFSFTSALTTISGTMTGTYFVRITL